MKRTASRKVPNYPKGLRARKQRTGEVYYYYEQPSSPERKEVALGSNYSSALMKRAKLLLNVEQIKSDKWSDFHLVSVLYMEARVPLEERRVQIEVRKSIERLQSYFSTLQLSFCESTIVDGKTAYLDYRGSSSRFRAGREWTLLWIILRWVSEICDNKSMAA